MARTLALVLVRESFTEIYSGSRLFMVAREPVLYELQDGGVCACPSLDGRCDLVRDPRVRAARWTKTHRPQPESHGSFPDPDGKAKLE